METSNLTPLNNSQKDREVSGWLSFFLFVVGLGAVATIIFSIAEFSLDSYDMGVGSLITYLFASFDIIYTLGIAGLALYTIMAFLNKRPNAVFLGKSYLIVIFLSNLLLLVEGDFAEYGLGSLSQIVKVLIWGIIWFLYLSFSKQVADIFPKIERKILKRDKYMIGSLIFAPVILLLFSVLVYLGNTAGALNVALEQGEYSDGTIIFRAPKDVVCEKVDTLESVFHNVAIGDSIWGAVIGIYDTNTTEEYFKECVDSWRDTELDGYDFSVLNTHSSVINRNLVRMQTVKYITQPLLYWQFAIMFNPQTGKACLISLYATTEEKKDLMNELMDSVRF